MWNSCWTNCSVRIRVSVIALTLVLCGVAATTIRAEDTKSVPAGGWGGEHIFLEVSEKGAQAELDCAHGKITAPLALDQRGDFDVAGNFMLEHGGPVRRDEVAASSSAHYSGHVEGDTMTLTIVLEKEKLGPFTLTRGSRPLLRKCR